MSSPSAVGAGTVAARVERRRGRRRALIRFGRHRMAVLGAAYLALTVLVAAGASFIGPYPYDRQDLLNTYGGPTMQHLVGTDALGRDMLSRLIFGARVSASVGITTTAIVLTVGVPVGLVAGYYGGTLDLLLMRLVDIAYSIPNLLLVILLQVFFTAFLPNVQWGPLVAVHSLNTATGGVTAIVIALSLIGWLDVARISRGQALTLRPREFVQAARSVGASDWRVIAGHLLPNVVAPIIVMATLLIPRFIIAEAALSFIGVGVQPPLPSWGIMLADGAGAIESYPRLVLAPAIVLALTLLSLNFVGDGLRDALDPSAEP